MRKIKRFLVAIAIILVALAGVFLMQRHYVINDWIAQHQRLAEIEAGQLHRFARDWSGVVLSLSQHEVLHNIKNIDGFVGNLRERQALEMAFLEIYRVYQPFIDKIRYIDQTGREQALVMANKVSRNYSFISEQSFLRKVLASPAYNVSVQTTRVNDGPALLEIAAPVSNDGRVSGVISIVVSLNELVNVFATLQSSGLVSNIYLFNPQSDLLAKKTSADSLSQESVIDVIKRIKTLTLTTPIYQIDGSIWIYLQSRDLNIDVLFQIGETAILRKVADRIIIIAALLVLLSLVFYLLGRAVRVKPESLAPLVAKETAVTYTSSNPLLHRLASDLRAPFAQWMTTLRILRETQLTQQQTGLVDQTLRSGQWQMEQLDRVIDYTASEDETWKVEEIDFDLRSLIHEWATTVRARDAGKNVRCLAVSHAFLPPRVKGDPTRLRQLLTIVWQTITESVAKGEVVIECRAVKQDKQQTEVAINFIADGNGFIEIARRQINQLLDLQADYGDPLQTISKRFFQRLLEHFSISVDVAEQPGSKRILSLKKRWPHAPLPSLQRAAADLSTKHVLLASENRGNRAAIQRVLQNIEVHGESVDQFALVNDRIVSRQESPYDIVLFDATNDSESESALNTVRDLKQRNAENGLLPGIVLLTHRSQPGEGLRARLAGVDVFLVKPITRTQLKTALGKLIVSRAGSEAPWITRHSLLEDEKTSRNRIILLEPDRDRRNRALGLLTPFNLPLDFVESRDELLAAVKRESYACALLEFETCGKKPFELVQEIRQFEIELARASGLHNGSDRKTAIIAYADDVQAARAHVTPNGLDDVLPADFTVAQLERLFKALQMGPQKT